MEASMLFCTGRIPSAVSPYRRGARLKQIAGQVSAADAPTPRGGVRPRAYTVCCTYSRLVLSWAVFRLLSSITDSGAREATFGDSDLVSCVMGVLRS